MKLPDALQQALAKMGITGLNSLQQAVFAAFPDHTELIVLSPTGSGKTLAYLLPLLQGLDHRREGVQALVITPTRELAVQIENVFRQLTTGLKVNAVYGGHAMQTERNNLSVPPAVLIGTPGRLADHLQRGHIDLRPVKTLILDEFDKSLEMGFHETMAHITEQLEGLGKRVLVSATDLQELPDFTGISSPYRIDFLSGKPSITYRVASCPETEKPEALAAVIAALNNEPAIIFCNHRETTERIGEWLYTAGIMAVMFHGGMEQEERERALVKFRNGSAQYLVTTDLAARGLDIPDLPHVIHYQLPPKEDAFIHRNGRTARQGKKGTVWILQTAGSVLPDYIPENEQFIIDYEHPLPPLPVWKTLYFGGGKKDKINKIDIAGFLSKTGKLHPAEIGLISVFDKYCLVAVKSSAVDHLMPLIRQEKVKGKRIKIGIAR